MQLLHTVQMLLSMCSNSLSASFHSKTLNNTIDIMLCKGSIVKAAKVKPSVFKDDAGGGKKKQSPQQKQRVQNESKGTTLAQVEKKNNKRGVESSNDAELADPEKKREIVAVEMSTAYQSIVKRLEKDSRPLLCFLKERKVISNEHQFFNLKPDITRFLIRQQEKRYEISTINAHGMYKKTTICYDNDSYYLMIVSSAKLGVPNSFEIHSYVRFLLSKINRALSKRHRELENRLSNR